MRGGSFSIAHASLPSVTAIRGVNGFSINDIYTYIISQLVLLTLRLIRIDETVYFHKEWSIRVRLDFDHIFSAL